MPDIRGVEIEVRDDGAGLPFLWGHGLVSSMEEEDRFIVMDFARLARRHRVIRWDARGHGRSRGARDPEVYRWHNLARDLLALADDLGVDRFVAGGVSMGAATALHAAVQAPQRVLGLVLMLAPTAYETRDEQADLYRAGAVLVDRFGMDAYIDGLKNLPAPELLAQYGDRFIPVSRVSGELLSTVLRGAASSDLPSPQSVRMIKAPTLLLPWVGDAGHPMSTSERLLELLPNVQIHVAHHLRDVGTWTDRIDSFLDARESETSHA
ncbi:MAG TPA: alpha/beta fold hydrolase [Acidimicrobiia bacterium]|nr:alpha/beta fold hydrolase [Acidimicrobiia bacterium]